MRLRLVWETLAYDSVRKGLFVTGKLWPSLFEIRVVPERRSK